ncbi:lithostathine-1-beta-like [Perca fluviatilis]|uniref:lithostathine-1-beta-like n=1 Tax=Perca fluviatilis TaxID=8168 RepID=UPI0019624D3E|nr:lithostathine-1-beta-like [Perca fluviatilis]
MTRDDALAYCRRHYTDLASVRNETENTMIQNVVSGNRVWIGLYRYTWRWWSDGTSRSFSYWADGHPVSLTESCAASVINATHLGKWVENHCNENLHFICQNNRTQLFNVKLTALKTTIDLNVPAVTDAILNRIKEKLMEEGITRDFKIFWMKKPGKNIFHKEEENADAVEAEV